MPDRIRTLAGAAALTTDPFEEALALQRAGRYDQAEAAYRLLVERNPAEVRAQVALGALLLVQRRNDEALLQLDAAARRAPEWAPVWFHRALALHEQGDFAGAVENIDRAAKLGASGADLHFNRANALNELRRFDEALGDYDRALELQPNHARAQRNRGILKLLLGDYAGGLADYESRRPPQHVREARQVSPAPDWRGEAISGKSLLVTDATGMGDEIHMVRYLSVLADRGARVSFFGKPALYRLFTPFAARVKLLREVPADAHFDYQCKLLSLPFLLGTRLETVPAQVPYLFAEPALVQQWRERIGTEGFRIGIGWKGNPSRSIDKGRSVPLAGFRALAALPGVRLVSLQKGYGLDELERLPEGMQVEVLENFDEGPDAFVDTAAVMANMDLVVSSCTSLPHLAGALAKPVWLAAKYVPEWRWGIDGENNAWYPTMRVFRQSTPGDWEVVFARMAMALRERLMN
jgi:Flp pilus assembly protein TadD